MGFLAIIPRYVELEVQSFQMNKKTLLLRKLSLN